MSEIRTDPKKIHRHFLEAASGLSIELSAAITRVGPIQFQADSSQPLAWRLFRSVTGQQLSVKAARSIWERVHAAAGDTPMTEFFIEKNAERLRNCGLSSAKIRTICGIAAEARAGGLEADDLRILNHESRSKILTSLWGVGPWTADMISIFYFGDEDVWPDGDLAARKNLELLTSRRRKTIRTAARFAPYRSYLAHYMWSWQDTGPF